MTTSEPPSPAERTKALVDALEQSGTLTKDSLDELQDKIEERVNWQNGAKVVARAWTDPSFMERLLADGTKACAELGFSGPEGEYMVVLIDEPLLHNVVVCTQCSCTAWPVLGLPPDWYKSPEYRARVAREPRPVLEELGLVLPAEVKVRVWDTTAETRFFVLPLRPEGTADWSEEQLASIVTRESMIGTALVSA